MAVHWCGAPREPRLGQHLAAATGRRIVGNVRSMPSTSTASGPPNVTGIPAGYVAVSLMPGQRGAPLRLCGLARQKPDAAAGHFILLHDTIDARVFLGCVTDAGGVVHKW